MWFKIIKAKQTKKKYVNSYLCGEMCIAECLQFIIFYLMNLKNKKKKIQKMYFINLFIWMRMFSQFYSLLFPPNLINKKILYMATIIKQMLNWINHATTFTKNFIFIENKTGFTFNYVETFLGFFVSVYKKTVFCN